MKSETAKITTGKGEDKKVFEELYTFPETMEEAVQVDGTEKVFKLYLQQRKIRWADGVRAEKTTGTSAETKGLTAKIRELAKTNPEALKQVAELLGIDLSAAV